MQCRPIVQFHVWPLKHEVQLHSLSHSSLVFTILLSFFILLLSDLSLCGLSLLSYHQEQRAVQQC